MVEIPSGPVPGRNFSPWAARMVRLAATVSPPPPPADDAATVEGWARRRRRDLAELLGRWPEPVPLRLETLEATDTDDYRRELVVFDTEAAMSVPAYLLVPHRRSRPGPAVLAVHGHGPGKDLVCGLATTESPDGDYAHQLARRGYVVLAPDLRCFGQRADWNPPDHYGCDTNLVHAVMEGVSPLTENLHDLVRALDVLAGHPLVDPGRMAAAGLSYGGTLTLFLAAWDERIRAAVVSGYLSSWAVAHRMPWNMCGSQVLPGMLGRFEHADLAALVAPRALCVESGRDDDLFPVDTAESTVATVRRVYEALGAGDRLAHDVFDGGHQWHGAVAYRFLDRHLGAPAD